MREGNVNSMRKGKQSRRLWGVAELREVGDVDLLLIRRQRERETLSPAKE
jgi:hypothetical protein